MAQIDISQVKFKHTGNPMKIKRGYAVSYLRGQAFANSSKTVYLKGQANDLNSHIAYTSGIIRSSTLAYLKGSINSISHSDAFVSGINFDDSLVHAFTEGWSASADADSYRTAYLKGTGQELLPIADITDGSWVNESSGSVLFSSLNDSNDSTYVWRNDAQVGEYFEVLLDVPTPLETGNYYIRFRIYRITGTVQATLKVELRQGDTVIADDTQNTADGVLEYSHQLTPGEIASISDWDDLRIRVTMMGMV